MSRMTANKSQEEALALYEALTCFNYFPNQRINISELPPSLNTTQFTPEVAKKLVVLETPKDRQGLGYDLVEYKVTRYNNVPRVLGLAHPKGYAQLVNCIHDNWSELKSVTENTNSIIKPQFYPEDKRVMVMNYEDPLTKVKRSHQSAFAKRFEVHTDIANCFNSIYSHAIEWAAVGMTAAKKQRGKRDKWFNRLDALQRNIKRNETQGIPIGPATSSIVVELILGAVDEKLRGENYEYHRYIDDYTCYCSTDDEAQKFIENLSKFLSEFKLTLNLSKTSVKALPCALEDDWVLEVRGALPSRLAFADKNEPKLSSTEALTFLNRAIAINKKTPDGSVLKYATSLIISHLDEQAPVDLIEALANLSWHYPVLLPLFDSLLNKGQLNAAVCQHRLNDIIKENARKIRSDGMAWPLHTMLSHDIVVDEETAIKVVKSGDCVAITLLLEMNNHNEIIIKFAECVIKKDDHYEKDRYWLLLYQLYRKDLLNEEPYKDGVFKCLKEHDVNFFHKKEKKNT